MWLAALASFVVSILGMFTIGAFVFVLTSVQLAATAALRWRYSLLRSIMAMLLGILIWIVLVPMQVAGYRWWVGLGSYQIVGIVALFVVLLPWDLHPRGRSQAEATPAPPTLPENAFRQ